MKKTISLTIVIMVALAANLNNLSAADHPSEPVPVPTPKSYNTKPARPVTPGSIDISTLDGVLKKLKIQTTKLTSLQADIQYLFVQDPDGLDSRVLQKGKFYYKKFKDRSKIRIDFLTRKQDDEKEIKQLEQITFDGVWLARIDHQMKTAKFDQQTKANKPVEAFEFISRTFPMVGFTKTEDLTKHYHLKMVKQDPKDKKSPIQINLVPKKDSMYVKDFKALSFWIDRTMFLPNRIRTTSVDDNVYDIKLIRPRVNKNIKNEVFNVEPPANFVQNRRSMSEK